MTYKLTTGWPQRLSDGAFVNPETNWEYLAWLAEGNTPAPMDLSTVQNSQIVTVNAACSAAITGGFHSSALGSVHLYPSQLTDQANLAANVLSSIYPGLPSNWTTPQICQDSGGVWGYINHTAAQIQQAGLDGKSAVLAALVKRKALVDQISAATTITAVQAVVW